MYLQSDISHWSRDKCGSQNTETRDTPSIQVCTSNRAPWPWPTEVMQNSTHCMHSYGNTVATPPPCFFSFMPFIETKTLLSWYQGWAELINVCNPCVSEGITALLHIFTKLRRPATLQRRNVTLHLQFKIKTDECIKKKIFQFYSKPSIYFSFLNPCSKFLLWSVQCVFFFPPITSHASFSRCIGSVNKYWAGMASLKKKEKKKYY